MEAHSKNTFQPAKASMPDVSKTVPNSTEELSTYERLKQFILSFLDEGVVFPDVQINLEASEEYISLSGGRFRIFSTSERKFSVQYRRSFLICRDENPSVAYIRLRDFMRINGIFLQSDAERDAALLKEFDNEGGHR